MLPNIFEGGSAADNDIKFCEKIQFRYNFHSPPQKMLSSVAGKTIGVLGGGQLGKMFAEAAHRLGLKVAVLDPAEDCPCHGLVDQHLVGDFKSAEQVLRLAEAKCVEFDK
jgi:phosphoglycerate dehydrogenase-like enzyme